MSFELKPRASLDSVLQLFPLRAFADKADAQTGILVEQIPDCRQKAVQVLAGVQPSHKGQVAPFRDRAKGIPKKSLDKASAAWDKWNGNCRDWLKDAENADISKLTAEAQGGLVIYGSRSFR